MRAARAASTLVGDGWLRESPSNPWPAFEQKFSARSKSSMRKCIFLPVPDEVRALAPAPSRAALASVPPPPPTSSEPDSSSASRDMPPFSPHRRDPRKDVRLFAAVPAGGLLPLSPSVAANDARHVAAHEAYAALRAAKPLPVVADRLATKPAAWWEDPIALGSLLILAPPIGLAAVWSSKRYAGDARWALTVMTALTMCLMSAIVIAALVMR
jgi:hypothetical protein